MINPLTNDAISRIHMLQPQYDNHVCFYSSRKQNLASHLGKQRIAGVNFSNVSQQTKGKTGKVCH